MSGQAPQILVSQQVGTVDAAVYTVASSTSATVASASICNVTASPVNVSVSLVKAGTALGDATHRVLSTYPLAANDTLDLTMIRGALLGSGDMISAFASTAAAVDLVVTGSVFA